MTGVVVRNWEAAVGRADIDTWINTFRDRVLPKMQALDGFLDVTFLTKRDGDPCHVKVLTRWRTMAAITAFAGDNPAQTVLPDFMAPFFKSYDAEATFYDEVLREEAND